jgi:hypothetical protein
MMPNINVRFFGTKKSRTNEVCLDCYPNTREEIFIKISSKGGLLESREICLDVPTAVKLSKELRRHIGVIKGQGSQELEKEEGSHV